MKRLVFCGLLLIILLSGKLIVPYIFADDDVTTIVVGAASSGYTRPIFKSNGMNAQGPWYPGHSASSILRIKNEYGMKITLNQLGMRIALDKKGIPLSFDDSNAQDYMKKMKIKIDYKNPFRNYVQGTIFEGSFEELINGVDFSVSIGDNQFVDLIYTIIMDESAESNIAGIVGKADFTVSVVGDTDNNDDNDGDRKIRKYIAKSVEKIPGLEDHWAHDCMAALLKKGYIQGYPDGSIVPDQDITRAEAACLVAKALGLDPVDRLITGYIDPIPGWAKGYVIAASEAKIFNGYPGRIFKANQKISRQEMVKALMIAFEKKKLENKVSAFKDEDKIGSWALKHVKTAVQNGIIEGYPDNTFRPKANITRAEAFTMICKLKEIHSEHKK